MDAVDENGSTPLINASKDAPDVVRALLAAGTKLLFSDPSCSQIPSRMILTQNSEPETL